MKIIPSIDKICKLIKNNNKLLNRKYYGETAEFEVHLDGTYELNIYIMSNHKKADKHAKEKVKQLFNADIVEFIDDSGGSERPNFWSIAWKID